MVNFLAGFGLTVIRPDHHFSSRPGSLNDERPNQGDMNVIHLQKDLEHLDKELLILSSMVEDATNRAMLALVDRRLDLARQVMREDDGSTIGRS